MRREYWEKQIFLLIASEVLTLFSKVFKISKTILTPYEVSNCFRKTQYVNFHPKLTKLT